MNQTAQRLNLGHVYRDNNTANTLMRFAREVTPMQHFRELFINARESGATKIDIGYDMSTFRSIGVKRLTVKDNGKGMNPDEMLKYLCSHNSSSKSDTSGVHENFGIGAKATCLTWNKYGLVYISYTEENPEGSMIWLAYDEVTNQYGAIKIPVYDIEDGEIVIDQDTGEVDDEHCEEVVNLQHLKLSHGDEGYLGVKWWNIRLPGKSKTGTIVICCGKDENDSTYEHDSRNKRINSREIHWYFMRRFAKIKGILNVKRDHRPIAIEGLKEFLDKKEIIREVVDFYEGPDRQLWSIEVYTSKLPFVGELQSRHSEYKTTELNSGMILIEYQEEFYHVKSSINCLRSWGINQKDVAKRTVLIIKPPIYHKKEDGSFFGAFPNERRDALYFQSKRPSDQDKLIDIDWLKPKFDANKPEHLEALLIEALEKKRKDPNSHVEENLNMVKGKFKTLRRKRERHDKYKACEGGDVEFDGSDVSMARGIEGDKSAQAEKEGNQKDNESSSVSSEKPNDPRVGTLKGKLKGKKTKVKDTTNLVSYSWKTHADKDELLEKDDDFHDFRDSDTGVICPFYYSHSKRTGELFGNKDAEVFRTTALFFAERFVNGDKHFDAILEIVKDQYMSKCLNMIYGLRDLCQEKKLNAVDLSQPMSLYLQCLGLTHDYLQIEQRIKREWFLKKVQKK